LACFGSSIPGVFPKRRRARSDLKTVAIIVNYKSADLTLQAVQSVLESESLGPVQVVVVDNSEDENEAGKLRLNLPPSVTVFVNPENRGFGAACNQAFDHFQGEFVLLINPDARLLPGCLLRLQKTLSSAERVAAVGPQAFWDNKLTYFLPPAYPPALFILQPFFGAQGSQIGIYRLLSSFWRSRAIRVWRSEHPVRVNNLSGGHVLLKRAAVQKSGGFFDTRFFLYYEDTDLFFRLRKAGFILLMEPRAAAVHYYDQCDRENWEEKRLHMMRSNQAFLEKHNRGWRLRLNKALRGFKTSVQQKTNHVITPEFLAPFKLSVPDKWQRGWLFEWSPNPNFIPSVGHFGTGPSMNFTRTCWSMLTQGAYFGRLGSSNKFGGCSQAASWKVERE